MRWVGGEVVQHPGVGHHRMASGPDLRHRRLQAGDRIARPHPGPGNRGQFDRGAAAGGSGRPGRARRTLRASVPSIGSVTSTGCRSIPRLVPMTGIESGTGDTPARGHLEHHRRGASDHARPTSPVVLAPIPVLVPIEEEVQAPARTDVDVAERADLGGEHAEDRQEQSRSGRPRWSASSCVESSARQLRRPRSRRSARTSA